MYVPSPLPSCWCREAPGSDVPDAATGLWRSVATCRISCSPPTVWPRSLTSAHLLSPSSPRRGFVLVVFWFLSCFLEKTSKLWEMFCLLFLLFSSQS